MSTYLLRIYENQPINYGPTSEDEEIQQNIRMIVGTVKGELPLDRAFGIDDSGQEAPMPVAQTLFAAAAIEAITDYEPRVDVDSIDFEQGAADSADGRSIAVIRYRRVEVEE